MTVIIIVGSFGGIVGVITMITLSSCCVLYYKKRSKINSLHDILLKLFIENNKNNDNSLLSFPDNRPSVSYYIIHY